MKLLKERIAKLVIKNSIELDPVMQSDFSGMISEMTAQVHQKSVQRDPSKEYFGINKLKRVK